MLFDGSWRKLAHKHENLCWNCFGLREGQWGKPMTLADLRPCPFNHERGYFDFYKRDASPELIEVWLRWLDRATEKERLWRLEQDREFERWKESRRKQRRMTRP
jgi:hypothetical protein